MYFLGQAANFRIKKTFRHLFSFGTKADFEALRQDLASKYTVSVDNVVLFHTGRTALALAIKQILKLRHNKRLGQELTSPEIAITSLTCFAVVQAVRGAGCVPVYVDIDPKTLHFDGKALAKTLKKHKNIQAVIIQNNLGIPVDLVSIEQVAKKHQLAIIEDLAHAINLTYPDGRIAGSVGDAVVLSFGKGKALDAISGGALILRNSQSDQDRTQPLASSQVATKRPKISDSLRDRFYPLFALKIRFCYRFKFGKWNLGRVLTALFLKLRWIKKSADADLDFSRRLTFWQAKSIRKELKNFDKNTAPTRRFYFVKDRKKTLNQLEKAGFIMDDIWYEEPVSPARYLQEADFTPKECPVAVAVAKHIVNLPIHYSIFELSKARLIIHKTEISIERNSNGLPVIPGEKLASTSNNISIDNSNSNDSNNIRSNGNSSNDIYQQYPFANFLQSKKWQKYNQKIGHQAFFKQLTPSSSSLMIIKDAKRGRFLEIPNGPLINWGDRAEVELSFAQIYQFAKEHRCVFIRFRPALRNTLENSHLLKILPLMPASFHLGAEDTILIDLERSEDEILASFRRQTRYEVRRAKKLGIQVESSTSKTLYQEFHQTQLMTAKRQHFIPPTFKELDTIRQVFQDQAKIYVSYDSEKRPIAYGLVLIDGYEGEYFEAASTDLNRKLPGAYAIQWQIIKDLKRQGIKRYNLWGIAPEGQSNHRYSGVTTFKTGFSEQRFAYIHAKDIPVRKIRYRINRFVEIMRKKRRHLS